MDAQGRPQARLRGRRGQGRAGRGADAALLLGRVRAERRLALKPRTNKGATDMKKGQANAIACRRLVLMVQACLVLIVSTLSCLADQVQPQPPLTDKQKELLKERDRHLAEYQVLLKQDKLPEAAQAIEKALALERQIYGDTHQAIVDSLNLLADLHKKQSDFAAARKALAEVEVLQNKLHGPEDWRTVNAHWKLVHLDQWAKLNAADRQSLEEATRLMQRAFELQRQGKYTEALEPCLQALEIRRKLQGEAHLQVAMDLNSLAYLYQLQGNFAKAEPLFR